MDARLFLVIFTLTIATLLVAEVKGRRRGNGGRHRGAGRHRDAHGTRYQWTRDLGAGNTSSEGAFAITEKKLVFLKSSDRNLTAAGFTKSATLYDFSSTTPLLAITVLGRSRQKPCYVTNTTLTYQGVIDILTNRSGQTAPIGSRISLDGSGDQLSREDVQELLKSNPTLRRVCKRGKIVRSAGTTAAASDSKEEVKVLILDAEVALTIPASTERSKNGSSRGGRRNGGGRDLGHRGRH